MTPHDPLGFGAHIPEARGVAKVGLERHTGSGRETFIRPARGDRAMTSDHAESTTHGEQPRLDRRLTRREWLARTGGGVLAIRAVSTVRSLDARAFTAVPDEKGGTLIVRSRRPLDLETPVSDLDPWVTSNDRFFVRSHFGNPLVGLRPWSVEVGGLVQGPLNLGLDQLKSFESVTIPALLQCSGNGRAFSDRSSPGSPGSEARSGTRNGPAFGWPSF